MRKHSLKCIILLIGLMFSMQGCKLEKKIPDDKIVVKPQKAYDLTNPIIKKLIIPKELKLDKNDSNFLVTIVFDGNCSFCVVQFLELVRKIKIHKSKQKIEYVFISYSQDLFKIENYLEDFHISLNKDEVLIADNTRIFNDKYDFASGNPVNMILSKKGGEIF